MYIGLSPILGQVDLTKVRTTPPGVLDLVGTNGSANNAWPGLIVPAYDSMLRSGGEFIYASVPVSTAIASGTWVELTFSLSSGKITVTAQAWAGGANSGKTLAIAYAAIASDASNVQYAWFQISGIAFSKVVATGTWAAGCTVAWSSSGIPQMTPVATKNVQNAQGVTGVSAQIGTNTGSYSPTSTDGYLLTATQALVFINRPSVSVTAA